jgi:hypothetical protein
MRAAASQGNLKVHRPSKGGGSISGRSRDNKGQPVDVNKAGSGTVRASKFQGNIKGILPGGGFSRLGADFTGFIKTRRPEKGGGSVSGKSRDNKGKPIEVKVGGSGTRLAGLFQGKIKTGRPQKGGGSVSGQLWNNRNKPINVETGGRGMANAAAFKGKTKYQKPEHTAGKPAKYSGSIKGILGGSPGFGRLGQDYEGDFKRKKSGIDNKQRSLISKLFKKDKTGMLPVTHIARDERIATKTQKGKRYIFSRYVQNPKAADASLKKDRLPNGIRLNVPVFNQVKRSVNAGHYVHAMKQYWDYKRNPNSSKQALKLREPGKANARVGDLQVNVKMKKYMGNQLHPDARFAHGYRDNVKSERTLMMNIKIVWGKLFKRSDYQPRGLKQKPGRPRFDPSEKGLWYD